MIHIEHKSTGERQLIPDEELPKYPRREWRVIERGVARPRGHCVREDGRWRVDRTRRAPTLAELLERIEALEARLAAIEIKED